MQASSVYGINEKMITYKTCKKHKSQILAYSDFVLRCNHVNWKCPTDFYIEIIIGSYLPYNWQFSQNKLVNPCNPASGVLAFYHFTTKSIQNNKSLTFSADPLHKIWEQHFKNQEKYTLQRSIPYSSHPHMGTFHPNQKMVITSMGISICKLFCLCQHIRCC